MIVLSERDVNRETTSQATDEQNLFNLTPEFVKSLYDGRNTSKDENSKPECQFQRPNSQHGSVNGNIEIIRK